MVIADLVHLLNINPVYRNRVVHMDQTAPVEARYGQLMTLLPPPLKAYLDQKKSGCIPTNAMPSIASVPGRM
jgi:hypothetical protein